jgi:hypothetical protein
VGEDESLRDQMDRIEVAPRGSTCLVGKSRGLRAVGAIASRTNNWPSSATQPSWPWLLTSMTGLAAVCRGAGPGWAGGRLWLVVHRPVAGAMGYGTGREGLVTTLAYATVGVMITSRRPEHPVGWLFLGAGLVGAAQLVTGEFAAAFLAASGPSVSVAVAAWASSLF